MLIERKIKISNNNSLNLLTYADTVGHYINVCKIAVSDMPSCYNLRQFAGLFLHDFDMRRMRSFNFCDTIYEVQVKRRLRVTKGGGLKILKF